ncbi:MAG: hypothetical protein N3E37_00600 [Candidatus Micrarchaeota archaeon]|nr:hypothetical protein [Candidatus Micrarchaeota archaeon]
MSDALRRSKGDVKLALMMYNGGEDKLKYAQEVLRRRNILYNI